MENSMVSSDQIGHATRQCLQCGSALPSAARFCRDCGTSVPAAVRQCTRKSTRRLAFVAAASFLIGIVYFATSGRPTARSGATVNASSAREWAKSSPEDSFTPPPSEKWELCSERNAKTVKVMPEIIRACTPATILLETSSHLLIETTYYEKGRPEKGLLDWHKDLDPKFGTYQKTGSKIKGKWRLERVSDLMFTGQYEEENGETGTITLVRK